MVICSQVCLCYINPGQDVKMGGFGDGNGTQNVKATGPRRDSAASLPVAPLFDCRMM